MAVRVWWHTLKSKWYPAAYKHTYTASGSHRHFCTAPCKASGWRSRSQFSAGLCQASLGPFISFPAPKLTRWTLLGERSTAEAWPLMWPIRLLLRLCYGVLDRCALEGGFSSAKAPRLRRFLPRWLLASWGMVSGFLRWKAQEARAVEEEWDGYQRDSWGKSERCACD